MTRIRLAAAAVLASAFVAACSSSSGNDAPSSTTSSSGTASASSNNSAAAALAATLRTGLTGLQSAHLVVDAGALGGKSEGDVAYANGQATGSDITLLSGTDTTELVTVGSTTYAKLPAARNTSGKPWVKVSASSKNEFVRALATSVDISKAAASLPAVAEVAGTASSVTRTGNTYALVVEPAKSADTSLGKLLATIGQQSVPVKLVLDAKGRPTDITITVKLGTQSFDVVIAVSKFDAPVTIATPPAGQVAS